MCIYSILETAYFFDLPNVTSSGELTESAVGEQVMETDEIFC